MRISPIIFFVLVALVGCVGTPKTKSSLELQAFQRREFDTTKDIAFKSVLSVFQDLGYSIDTADYDTGIITASSPKVSEVGWFSVTIMNDTKATAHIEDIRNDLVSIRLTFLNREEQSSVYGAKSEKSNSVEDPRVFDNAFQKISEAIFIRKETH